MVCSWSAPGMMRRWARRGSGQGMTAEQVLERLRGPPRAAEDRQAGARKAQRGGGVTAELGRAVGGELRDPLTPVLALGAAASAIVGSAVDAALVGGVMVGNALIGGVQRVRAERALHALLFSERLPARRVASDGTLRSVAAERLRTG